MNRPAAHLTRLVLCLLLAASLSACSGEPAPPRQGSRPAEAGPAPAADSVSLAAAPVVTRSRFHRIYGRLPESRRKSVRRQVSTLVETWWDAAYLGGTYPRTGFRDAFPGFTRGARAQARRDVRLMSNRDIGARVESVTAKHGSIRLDVLAVGRHAHAVTARFVLRFATVSSTSERRSATTVVRGRLFLTRPDGAWRVFGYDVSKAVRA